MTRIIICSIWIWLTFSAGSYGQRVYSPSSVLATGNWYKIAVDKPGIYKVDLPFLAALGINISGLSSSSIRLFGNGGQMLPENNAASRMDDLFENAIMVVDGGDGILNGNDYFLFFAIGPDAWIPDSVSTGFKHQKNLFAEQSFYFINIGSNGKRIAETPLVNSSAITVNSFSERYFHELDSVNFLQSGKMWWGEELSDIPGRKLSRNFLVTDAGMVFGTPFTLIADVAARSVGQNSRFDIQINNQTAGQIPVGSVSGGLYDFFARQGQTSISGITGNSFDISFKYVPGGFNAQGWINWFELFYRKELKFSNNAQLLFRDRLSVAPGNIARFEIDNATASTQVWDVTNPLVPLKMQGSFLGNKFEFLNNSSQLREYVAFNGNDFFKPKAIGKISNQNLHHTSPVDLLIITTPDFVPEALRLAHLHQNQNGLRAETVTTDAVFNEFASGSPDPSAIRDFVKMYYDKYRGSASDRLKYLVLFGDASFDYKERITGNTNFVPAFQSASSLDALDTYTSDDFFGFLDDNEDINNYSVSNLLDIGIGRVPVKNMAEAKNFVDKVQVYLSPQSLGAWRNNLSFIADDEDNNLHAQDAEVVTTTVSTTAPVFTIQKIYLDAFQQESGAGGSVYPKANLTFSNQINSGSLIINYNGHGGPVRLAEETILDRSIVDSWNNSKKLPLFITATCDFAPFDNPLTNSLGENILVRPQTGGIALMTTTRPVFAFSNRIMNNNYLHAAFHPDTNGRYKTLGDAIKEAKNFTYQNNGDIINNRKFTLLGDPALTLSFPETGIRITKINNLPVLQADTLSALENVIIEGEITDNNGNLQQNFSGTVYPVVFDKPQTINTLANDVSSQVMSFQLQQAVLFKGKTTVNAGRFSFSFKVPKDINYQFGKGKISLYADNSQKDVNGFFTNFYVGGSGTGNLTDHEGPDIKVYFNDERFANGGLVNQRPLLLVKLSDSSGINIAGAGIDHDIVATLDGDNRKYFILNDFFQNEINSYQKGEVRFQMPELEPGTHTLKLKAWDVANNSSEAEIAFTVANDEALELKHVLNYPNPFTTRTGFWFEHNKPGMNLDVSVEIMTVTGKIIKSIRQQVFSEGNSSHEINWDGRDEFGDKVGRGVYIYRLSVRAQGFKTAEKTEKLVVF